MDAVPARRPALAMPARAPDYLPTSLLWHLPCRLRSRRHLPRQQPARARHYESRKLPGLLLIKYAAASSFQTQTNRVHLRVTFESPSSPLRVLPFFPVATRLPVIIEPQTPR